MIAITLLLLIGLGYIFLVYVVTGKETDIHIEDMYLDKDYQWKRKDS